MKTSKKTSTSTKKAVSTKANSIALTKAPDHKMAAANDVDPAVVAASNVTPANAAVALNQETALKPEVAAKLKEKAAPKPKEEFLTKLRSKGDLLAALKAGGILYLENGLWRLDPGREDKKVHRVSKRRAAAFRAAELVLPVTQPGARAHSFELNQAKAAEEAVAKKAPKPSPAPADPKAVTK
jgi:hypothetical protein